MVVTESTKQVVDILKQRAAKIWEIDKDAVNWENGEARPAGDNAGKFKPLTLAQIADKATPTGGPIGAGHQVNTVGAEGGFATHICDVEVDIELGIARIISIQLSKMLVRLSILHMLKVNFKEVLLKELGGH